MAVMILLSILKVILWILLILLLLILYLLLVPWGIRGRFRLDEEEQSGSFTIKSFLRCFQLVLDYTKENKLQFQISLFWGKWKLLSYPESEGQRKTGKEKGFPVDNQSEEEQDEGKKNGRESKKKEKRKEKKKDRKKSWLNFKEKIGKVFQLLRKLFSEPGKAGIHKIRVELFGFLRRLGLHFTKTEMHFAGSGPDVTGEILGVLAMIPWAHQPGLKIRPDFTADKAYFKGHGQVRGHLLVGDLLLTVIRLLMDKNVRTLLHAIGGNKK
jgi:hypothetical protein